jgi:hypothetical protein
LISLLKTHENTSPGGLAGMRIYTTGQEVASCDRAWVSIVGEIRSVRPDDSGTAVG